MISLRRCFIAIEHIFTIRRLIKSLLQLLLLLLLTHATQVFLPTLFFISGFLGSLLPRFLLLSDEVECCEAPVLIFVFLLLLVGLLTQFHLLALPFQLLLYRELLI
mmetsp:Transcript_9138/g.10792  ORF Transcript_9138/g.10792 Transcript_9138/m.10792 type:complete len:106 (+) Transcript_9138:1402-1719(+)